MNQKSWLVIFNSILCCFFLSTSNGQSASANGIVVNYTPAPIFKRLAFNPVIRIRICVPANAAKKYRSIQLSLDKEAVNSIEKLEMFTREDGEEIFLPSAKLLASTVPSMQVSLPINLEFHAGLSYIWISPVLKLSADMDKKIRLEVKSLTDENGKQESVASYSMLPEGQPNFFFRLGVAIRKSGDDSVNAYRIPGLITASNGVLVAVYDVRYVNARDLPGNIDVGMSRSMDGGRTWEPMKIIMDMGSPQEENGVGDPSVLFDPATKKIWVAALWSKGNHSIAGSEPGLSPDSTGQLVLVSSADNGVSWTKPFSITSQVKNPIWHIYFQGPGNGIAMQNGTLVFPSQYWDETRKPGIPHSAIIYSTDHGVSWKSGTGAKSNTTESQVVETVPGTLMLNMRDNRGGYRSVATTTNMGQTWTEHPTSQQSLPDPICMGSIIKTSVNVKGQMKNILFFSNSANQFARVQSTVKASANLGESWPKNNYLLIDARRSYGYSALSRIDSNTIGLLYEGEKDLYFVRIPVSEIVK